MLFLFQVRKKLLKNQFCVWTAVENMPMAAYQVCLQSESILQFTSIFIKNLTLNLKVRLGPLLIVCGC